MINIIGLSVGMVCSRIIAIIIALATISYRAIRTAQMDPVDSLRYE